MVIIYLKANNDFCHIDFASNKVHFLLEVPLPKFGFLAYGVYQRFIPIVSSRLVTVALYEQTTIVSLRLIIRRRFPKAP